ncbi:vacuolar protein sorting-associated protein 64 [Podospora australis]|uniref:Vacuolar protein sorting-associated protein 64 n=1 Tax=Podospora australis TaxID=1536484 RepID=A0AAN6WQL4_9PEZI|nr:vacuolar protein sorting-associated protein 64 [Podospora australis]
MTAVASPPSFASLNRPGWINGGQMVNSINSDDGRGMNMFMSRKTLQRTNSSSSVSSTSSNGSASTVTTNASSQISGSSSGPPAAANGDSGQWPNGSVNGNGAPRKRPPSKGPWPNAKSEATTELSRTPSVRPPLPNGVNGTPQLQPPPSVLNVAPPTQLMAQNGISRPAEGANAGRQPVLYLLSLNGSFERKTINVPYYPDTLRIGRQTNNKTVPTPANGFFDSKVLSRQHAEIWADANGKIWIRDVKSSNGTFVNGSRLSPENRESEPHELQTQDHLELGIDIVSEDHKTVVHHKVAAKVEHAGFITPSNNVLEMNLGELDPSNNVMLSLNGAPFRGRTGSQASFYGNRPPPGNVGVPGNAATQQRQFISNPITTEQIIKKLHAEMRNARLQSQDLARTGDFLNTLVSKEDVRNMDKPEAAIEAPKNILTNGNISFRSDGGKTRFSDPPAPPPSQPLPEKPDASRPGSSGLSSLKRATTERPKPANSSPIQAEKAGSVRQISQLTEQLDKTKKELDERTQRLRDLEEMLNQERQARLLAEAAMVQRLEESSQAKGNGSVVAPLVNGHAELATAFGPPVEKLPVPERKPTPEVPELEDPAPQLAKNAAQLAAYQATIESMAQQMDGLRGQLELFKARAEMAEAQRDTERAARQSLAEMVQQLRKQQEEEKKRVAEKLARSRSRGRKRTPSQEKRVQESVPAINGSALEPRPQTDGPADEITGLPPASSHPKTVQLPSASGGVLSFRGTQDPTLYHTLPYASVIGVVLFGMGLMAYLNDWQLQPTRLDR